MKGESRLAQECLLGLPRQENKTNMMGPRSRIEFLSPLGASFLLVMCRLRIFVCGADDVIEIAQKVPPIQSSWL